MINSDKYYWHRYIDEYERLCFSHLTNPTLILEFGVLAGESIRFLSERFPSAKVIGVDKDDPFPHWPQGTQIQYKKLNQKDRDQVGDYLKSQGSFDLIIDDGSHDPQHQANCLIEGLKALATGGFYIIEDIQTNLNHPGSPLYFVLALEHAMSSKGSLSFDSILSPYFTQEEMVWAAMAIEKIHIYKRSLLPITCYMCKKSDYDFEKLECKNCHIHLYDGNDSMAAIIQA